MSGKRHRKKQNRIQITENGRKNQWKVGKIRGDLAEEFTSDLLARLADDLKIQSFRKATKKEDNEHHTDFVLILNSGLKIGLQVKSSDYGASKFRMEEKIGHAKRDYPVAIFVPNQLMEKAVEVKRLAREIIRFESSLKKKVELCI